METKARLDGDYYVLNGSKLWITNAPVADVMIVWARNQAENGRVCGFILERGQEGLTTPEIKGKFSLRASPTGGISMDEVRVHKDRMLPGARGLAGPFSCLNSARFGIAFGALGAGEHCVEVHNILYIA